MEVEDTSAAPVEDPVSEPEIPTEPERRQSLKRTSRVSSSARKRSVVATPDPHYGPGPGILQKADAVERYATRLKIKVLFLKRENTALQEENKLLRHRLNVAFQKLRIATGRQGYILN
jgi:hypothetical protein